MAGAPEYRNIYHNITVWHYPFQQTLMSVFMIMVVVIKHVPTVLEVLYVAVTGAMSYKKMASHVKVPEPLS